MNNILSYKDRLKSFIYRTIQAMSGNLTFREALKVRLDIIKPSYQSIQEFNEIQKSKLNRI